MSAVPRSWCIPIEVVIKSLRAWTDGYSDIKSELNCLVDNIHVDRVKSV